MRARDHRGGGRRAVLRQVRERGRPSEDEEPGVQRGAEEREDARGRVRQRGGDEQERLQLEVDREDLLLERGERRGREREVGHFGHDERLHGGR